jgi:hypothetical protein
MREISRPRSLPAGVTLTQAAESFQWGTSRQSASRKASRESGGRYPARLAVHGGGSGERLFLDLEIGVHIDLGRLDLLMPQPQRDHGRVDPRFQ